LFYSFVSAPASASLDVTSGAFSWRAPVCRAGTSNYIQLRVTDDGNPPLSSTQSFAIFINQLPPVTLVPVIDAGGLFLLQLNGPVGLDYTVQTAAALTNGGWVDWVTVRPGSLPFNLNDALVASFTNRFYRVRLGH
jgi:hypothetical protein